MRKTLKINIDVELNLGKIIKYAKYAFLLIVITYPMLNIAFYQAPYFMGGKLDPYFDIFIYSINVLCGIITALIFEKKIKELSFLNYAVVCVIVYLFFWSAFLLYSTSDWYKTSWETTLYLIFYFPAMHVLGISIITHLIAIFIRKRMRQPM